MQMGYCSGRMLYFPLLRRLLMTMARETRELAGMSTAARRGLMWPVRQRAMATVL